jgi:hypothetical protein
MATESDERQATWNLGVISGLAQAREALDGCLPEAPTYAQDEVLTYLRAELLRRARDQIAGWRTVSPPPWPE